MEENKVVDTEVKENNVEVSVEEKKSHRGLKVGLGMGLLALAGAGTYALFKRFKKDDEDDEEIEEPYEPETEEPEEESKEEPTEE